MSGGTGELLLVPAPLEQGTATRAWLCDADLERVRRVRHWRVETPKVARAWLNAIGMPCPLAELDIVQMPPIPSATARDGDVAWQALLAPLRAGADVAVMSDAGAPGVADPGARLVACAHEAGFTVRPLIGPSALLLAVMAAGLEGQRFAFHGYLPIAADERIAAIGRLAARSAREREAQWFIETPFRNDAMLSTLLEALPADARLGIAVAVGSPREWIRTQTVAAWRAQTIGNAGGQRLDGRQDETSVPASAHRFAMPRDPAMFGFECPAMPPRAPGMPARAPSRSTPHSGPTRRAGSTASTPPSSAPGHERRRGRRR